MEVATSVEEVSLRKPTHPMQALLNQFATTLLFFFSKRGGTGLYFKETLREMKHVDHYEVILPFFFQIVDAQKEGSSCQGSFCDPMCFLCGASPS